MATGDGNSWWGSFLKTAKEKSMSTLEIIKTDLAEFTSTMTTDATSLLSQASAQLIETTSSASSFLKSDSEVNADDNHAKTATRRVQHKKATASLSTIQQRYADELKAIQANENTYLMEPKAESSEGYAQWQAEFNLDGHKAAISDLLIENSSMRLLYSQLVPVQISNDQFWCRYFFKVNQFEEEHTRRIKLLERASAADSKPSNDDSLDWDDENEDDSNPQPETKNQDRNEETAKLVVDDLKHLEVKDNNEEDTKAVDSAPTLETPSSAPEAETADDASKITQPPKPKEDSKLELSQKTEDSDEWEKVSDVVLNEIDSEKKKAPEGSPETTNKQNEKKNATKTTVENQNTESSKKPDEDWDDWD